MYAKRRGAALRINEGKAGSHLPSLGSKVMTSSGFLVSYIFRFLRCHERMRLSSVCCIWNTPIVHTHIMRLDLHDNRRVTDEVVGKILTKYTQVRAIDLSGCAAITDTAVNDVSVHCRYLQHIDVSNCKSVTDDGVETLGRCMDLRSVALWGCDRVEGKCIRKLQYYCPHLQVRAPGAKLYL